MQLFTIKQASDWASNYIGKNVTQSNISYLLQYGRVKKIDDCGLTKIAQDDLIAYYSEHIGSREKLYKNRLGNDINWALSFEQYKESETTKHVHRLHPYKGKFIPQLVEYFLDSRTDQFKKAVYFAPNDIILDPFCGSGTTLVQANELGMHAIGIDVSEFNALIGNCKIKKHNLAEIKKEITKITIALKSFENDSHIVEFDKELVERLNSFNKIYFPVPEFKYRLYRGEIDETQYAADAENKIVKEYYGLLQKYNIQLKQNKNETFLDHWYLQPIRNEIDLVLREINNIQNRDAKQLIGVIFSRVVRSCRATTHSDLATLNEPIAKPYYCGKHGKICKPLFSIVKWWETYAKDTIKRIDEFDKLRTDTMQICLTGDSRAIDISEKLKENNLSLGKLVEKQKISGIFSSPPYVGLIDYHEQHAYAYDLFGFERNDRLEIGALFKGNGAAAKKSYIDGVAEVLTNCKRFLIDDYSVFLVANDKFGLYPQIAEKSEMKIVNEFKRPVLNRSEKDKSAYSETIFHMKEK